MQNLWYMPIWTSGATGSSWNDFGEGEGRVRKAGEEARRDPAD